MHDPLWLDILIAAGAATIWIVLIITDRKREGRNKNGDLSVQM